MERKKIKVTFSSTRFINWYLNKYINYILWKNMTFDDEDKAVTTAASIINKYNKNYKIYNTLSIIVAVFITILIGVTQYLINKYLLKEFLPFILANMFLFIYIYIKWFNFCFKK
jgi:hypothetical protein